MTPKTAFRLQLDYVTQIFAATPHDPRPLENPSRILSLIGAQEDDRLHELDMSELDLEDFEPTDELLDMFAPELRPAVIDYLS